MAKLFVKTGDTVKVITGDDKGTTGKVQKVNTETGRIIVEKVNMVKKHQKPRGQGMPGGIIEKEASIDASNVMIVCPACKKATKVGHKFNDGEGKASRRKVRVCKECGATIE
jgi:large subunit ribosomal protein L24